jgi:glucose/mannose transport system substrate-binding protein
MEDFASNALCPSIAHGSAAPEGFIVELNDALNIFVTTRNRDAFLRAFRNAAEDYID